MKIDLLDAYREICRKSGDVFEFDRDYYRWFSGLNDDELEMLLVDLVLANAEAINRMAFEFPRRSSDHMPMHLTHRTQQVVAVGQARLESNTTGSAV